MLTLLPTYCACLLLLPQEDKEGTDLGVLKNVMAHNWVEPSKRERKRVLNYSEAEYFKQVSTAVALQGAISVAAVMSRLCQGIADVPAASCLLGFHMFLQTCPPSHCLTCSLPCPPSNLFPAGAEVGQV
jgi:hypothetical protein